MGPTTIRPASCPGSDFVAAGAKSFDNYAHEFEATGRALKFLNDEAFRDIALGDNYFRVLGLDYRAPSICPPSTRAAAGEPK